MENPRRILTPEEKQGLKTLLLTREYPALEAASDQYIEYITEKPWNDAEVLAKIRKSVIAQKDSYWKEGAAKNVVYKGAYSVFAYLAYQMPGYVHEVSELFANLVSAGLIRKHIRILDIGCGPGTVSVAVSRVLDAVSEMTADITSVEPAEPFRDAFVKIVPALVSDKVKAPRPLALDITKEIPDGEFDLIFLANMINELPLAEAGKEDLIMRLSEHLVPDGNIVLIEPADLENATALRTVSRGVKRRGLTIYAPCNDIRGVPCPVQPCWSFAQSADIKPTKLMFSLGGEEEKYRFVNTDIKYAYAVLRKDGHRKCSYRIPPDAKRAWFSQLKKHIGRRIHVTCSVMSEDIGDAKNYLFLVCDGTGTSPVYAALPAFHRTPEHEALLCASYGDVVAIDSVLVRWNEKQKAYNLLLGQESWCRLIVGKPGGKKCLDKAQALVKKYGTSKRRGVKYAGSKPRQKD
ncbi:MAG TPA: methyltransferase domain-containing protein [Methanocorpusculum sp.]|nr:methyltransferase domain-containing protein [Methanocorpusculum sp.]